MQTLRKPLAVVLCAILVWIGAAGGLLSSEFSSGPVGTTPNRHGQEALSGTAHHHGAMDHATMHERSDRDCARSCLGNVAVKLVPQVRTLEPPQLITFPVVHDDLATILPDAEPALAYWPAAPPDGARLAEKGAARLLGRNSHLRI